MTCEHRERTATWLAGRLNAEEAQEAEQHAATCTECRLSAVARVAVPDRSGSAEGIRAWSTALVRSVMRPWSLPAALCPHAVGTR